MVNMSVEIQGVYRPICFQIVPLKYYSIFIIIQSLIKYISKLSMKMDCKYRSIYFENPERLKV